MMEGAVSGGNGPSCLSSLRMVSHVPCWSILVQRSPALAGITSRQQRGDADHSVQQQYKLWLVGFMGIPHGNACPPFISVALSWIA